MKLSPAQRSHLVAQCLSSPDDHLVLYADEYRPDGNVQITVDHLTMLLHRYLYEMVFDDLPPYLLPDCALGKLCQNPHHRLASISPRLAKPKPSRNGTPISANRAKTHCPHDHEYTLENTYIWVDRKGRSHRKCKLCTIKRTRAQHRAERRK